MYIHNFICTYKLHNDIDQDDMYRAQYLQAFGLEEWDDQKIENSTKILFDQLNTRVDLSDIINKIKTTEKFNRILQFMDTDDYSLFKLLFIFELFDLAHQCFCDILNKDIADIKNKNILLDNI